MKDKREMFLTYLKSNVAPVLVDFLSINELDFAVTIPADIDIKGTIFGGGEANASGDENYDYPFISVTNGINIKIDGKIILTLILMVPSLEVVMPLVLMVLVQ